MVLDHDWPRIKAENLEAVRAQVCTELAQIKASNGMTVLDRLQGSGLSDGQQARVLDALGEVREHYARSFKTDNDQLVNWFHTQGELGRVIDAAKVSGLSPTETEDALLASMFSDSLKTKANFTIHHLDGERSAEYILKDKLGEDFTLERLQGILHAIREHQVAPPAFMAMIYSGAIRKSIGEEKRALTKAEAGAFTSLFRKMSDPFRQALADAPDGGKMLILTDEESTLLARTGTDKWYVPSDSTPWHKIARALIDGDGIDNYATPGGLSKIIQIRGPETGPFFKDGNFRYESPGRKARQQPNSSQGSWRDSFDDFTQVASPEGLRVAQSTVQESERAALNAQMRVDAWLHERLGIPTSETLPTIPGWTGKPLLAPSGKPIIENGRMVMQPDNLKYPDYEPQWWKIHVQPRNSRTPEERAFYEDPTNRYRGLTDKEIHEFELAKEIRDQYAAELRKEQQVAGSAAPNYEPVQLEEARAEEITQPDVDRILKEMNAMQYTAMAYALSGEALPDDLAKQYAKLERDLEEARYQQVKTSPQ